MPDASALVAVRINARGCCSQCSKEGPLYLLSDAQGVRRVCADCASAALLSAEEADQADQGAHN